MKFAQKSGGGGGYNRSNINRSEKYYLIALNKEKQLDTSPSYKTKYSTLSVATRIVSWLLLFCTLLVLAMTPIFSANKKVSLDAGQTDSGTQYNNAPWVQVNSANALFTGGSSLNPITIYDLLAQINSTAVWSGVTEGTQNTYLSAKNFGKLDSTTNNAQLLVTLFDGATLDAITTTNNRNLDISNASKMQWQVVYRSMSNTKIKDVLTLYMNHTYVSAYYDYTSPYYGYYKDSNLREVARATYTALVGKYSALDNYVVLPNALPGLWQSSAYQTGSDKPQSSYTSGASKASGGASSYAINNGMDTKGTLHSSWTSTSTTTTDPYSNDKLWVPSNYEVIYKDNRTDGVTSYVTNDASGASATLTDGTTGGADGENDGRTGLWELNGYDRASNSLAWLRSGYSLNDCNACDINPFGGRDDYGVYRGDGGVRVALHLSVDSLAKELCEVSASSTASSGTAPTYTLSTASRNLQTVTTYNYKNYLVPNNTTEKGSATVTFTERSATRINSFTLNGTSINVNSANGSGKVNGVCDYSYTYENGKLAVSVSNLSVSTKIVANAAKTQTLTIDANGGTFASGVSNTAQGAQNSTYSLPSASQLTKTGYTLSGYTLTSGGGSVSGFTYTFGSSSGTIKANWTAISYSITYNLDGGSISGQKTSYTIETSTFTLQTPIKAGYTFSGWTGSNGTTPQTSVTITKGSTGNKTYTANWTLDIANVTLSITLNNSGRQYMIYILDSTGQPKHQFVVQKSGTIKFTISKNEKFSVLVFETLYMTTTIDGETTRKKVYNSGVSADKTIPITISSASNQVNNWLIV